MTTHGDGLIPFPVLLIAALLLPFGVGAVSAAESSRPARAALFRAPGFPTVDAPADRRRDAGGGALGPSDRHDRLAVRARGAAEARRPRRAGPSVRQRLPARGLDVDPGVREARRRPRRARRCALPSARAPGEGRREHALRPRPSPAHLRPRVPDRAVGRARRGVVRRAAEGDRRRRGRVGRRHCPEPKRTWALTVRLATSEDMPGEGGTAGPRDGVVRPLVHLVDAKGVARLCPLLEIDRLRGGGGGRPVGARAVDARLDAATIRKAVERALEGASELDARPVRAAGRAGRGGDPPRPPAAAGAARGGGRPVAGPRDRADRRRGRGLRRRGRALGPPRDAGRSRHRAHRGRARARPLPRGGLDARRAVAPAERRHRLLGEGRGAPRGGAEALRLARLAPGRREGAAGRRHDVHGLRRAPQVPVRAQPARVGPGLRRT